MMSTQATKFTLLFVFFLSATGLLLYACANTPQKKPALESIAPRSSFENQETLVTLKGHFPNQVEGVALRGANGVSVSLQNVAKQDSSTITATVPAESPPGFFDVSVTLKDSPAILLGGAFEIRPNALQIHIIDVGQGDATLVVSPSGETLLIDAGTESNAVEINRLLRELKIGQIDHILATHYDKDHVEGFANVLRGTDGQLGTQDDHTPRKKIWDRGGSVKNKAYRDIREEMKKRYPGIHQPLAGDKPTSFPTIDLGAGVEVKIVTVNGSIMGKDGKIHRVNCEREENCYSIGTLIKFGKFKFWTGGDLTGGGINTPDLESKLAEHLSPVDVYRVHHHGSRTSSNSKFIQAIKPQVAVFSMGKENSFCHPHTETIRNIARLARSAFLLTTPGLTGGKGRCSNSPNTQSYIGSQGSKVYVGLGTFYLEVQKDKFSLKGRNAPPNLSWQARN